MDPNALRRREFLRAGLLGPLALSALAGASALTGCGGSEPASEPESPAAASPPAAQAAPPEPAPAPAAPPDAAALITEIPANAALVESLHYVNVSDKPDQRCSACQFFTARGDGARGKCQLFAQGLVSAQGWCSSWVKKA